jgi:hypothetical protein
MWGHFRVSDHALSARAAALAYRTLFVAQLWAEGWDGSHGNHQPDGGPADQLGWGDKTARDFREGRKLNTFRMKT